MIDPVTAMRKLLLTTLLALPMTPAHAQIYECVDPGGNKRFTNIKSEAKGCKQLSIEPINTVPPPKRAGKATAVPSPATFPRVDTDTQKQRDAGRRRILEQELANEQKLLDQAQQELAEQESTRLGNERNYQRVLERLEPYRQRVKRHEDNIASLKQELANLK
jgi:hypothetical protein